MSAPKVQTPDAITREGPFQPFASSEPISLTGIAQCYGVQTCASYGITADFPTFTRHSSPIGRRLSFTDSPMAFDVGSSHIPMPDVQTLEPQEEVVIQEEVHQRRSKREAPANYVWHGGKEGTM
ncbi:uncharacterized protein LOC132066377 [Lycium ferocissimum]|uniref:uncharacterized protein LOC132066377 n=1 Tax=Lycium ferocissimum TaxID=112874 RepID=UPI002815B9F9|nr:uncharacterized protein LOC132066377 [Lycium ferocissimum]